MSHDMRRAFASRAELIDYLRAEFPQAAAFDDHVSEMRGGRQAAEARLQQIDARRYAQSRSYLNGAVTRLSPYLRHGVLSLAEVRDAVLARAGRRQNAAKLISELGWRDYFQRVYAKLGKAIWQDREPNKTGWQRRDYVATLPADIAKGETGLACMDAFSAELRTTGYLHNHARMWVAAYVVHWRRVAWQAGARWFLTHLLDGDPASNNLSWQWIASTFSVKPYIFTRDNLEQFTDGQYCRHCPARERCPFDAPPVLLERQLFPHAKESFT